MNETLLFLYLPISATISVVLFLAFMVVTTILHEYVHYYCYKIFYRDKDLKNIIFIRTLKSYSTIKINKILTIFYVGKDEYKNFDMDSKLVCGKYVNNQNFKNISSSKLVITAILPRIIQTVLYILIVSFVYLVLLLMGGLRKEIIKCIYYCFMIIPIFLISIEVIFSKKKEEPVSDQEIVKNPNGYLSGNYNNNYEKYKVFLDDWLKNNMSLIYKDS